MAYVIYSCTHFRFGGAVKFREGGVGPAPLHSTAFCAFPHPTPLRPRIWDPQPSVEKSPCLRHPLFVNLELPEIENTELTSAELRLELACALYARGKISAVTGAHLATLDLISFQGALKERGIPRNYTLEDFRDDMGALRKLFPA